MKNYLLDMLVAIINGQLAKRRYIYYRRLNIGENFLRVLWQESFIAGYKIDDADTSRFLIYLHYPKQGGIFLNKIVKNSKHS